MQSHQLGPGCPCLEQGVLAACGRLEGPTRQQQGHYDNKAVAFLMLPTSLRYSDGEKFSLRMACLCSRTASTTAAFCLNVELHRSPQLRVALGRCALSPHQRTCSFTLPRYLAHAAHNTTCTYHSRCPLPDACSLQASVRHAPS